MKLLFFDIETTGTMHWKNGIHQLSGMIEIDGVVKETFDLRVCPNPKAIIVPEALEVAGVTVEQIMAYPEMNVVYGQFVSMLAKYVDKFKKSDKFFTVGYNNSSFDNPFLRAWFTQNEDKYFGSWFWSSPIDVMVLAAEFLKEKRHKMIDFKLKTVAREMGIEVDETKLHDAQYDNELTRNIYKLITKQNG